MNQRLSENTTRQATSATNPGDSSGGGKNTSTNSADIQNAPDSSNTNSKKNRNLLWFRVFGVLILWTAAFSLAVFLSDLSFLIFLISWVQMGKQIETIKKDFDQSGAEFNHPESITDFSSGIDHKQSESQEAGQ